MNVELLVSAMHSEPTELIKKMNVSSNAVIINQCDSYSYQKIENNGHTIHFYSMNERGVGRSRNNALLRATSEISMFSDGDIEYYPDYAKKITDEFIAHPEADLIFFNFDVDSSRQTYHTETFHKVSWYNAGRYPTFCMAIRTAQMHAHNLTFSLLFGGGARFSNGEDSLFIRDCMQAGLKAYASPVVLGKEDNNTPSTWFSGYHEKFFLDRGVLYHFLYGKAASLFGLRFILKHQEIFCKEIPTKKAFALLRKGILIGKQVQKGVINE